MRQGASRERGTQERGDGSRVMARPTDEVPAGEEAGHRMARQVVHPALLPQLRHDGVDPGEAAHARTAGSTGTAAPTQRGQPPATRNQTPQCRRDTGSAALPTCVWYHDAEAAVQRRRGRSRSLTPTKWGANAPRSQSRKGEQRSGGRQPPKNILVT
jgi:hypothetical protein